MWTANSDGWSHWAKIVIAIIEVFLPHRTKWVNLEGLYKSFIWQEKGEKNVHHWKFLEQYIKNFLVVSPQLKLSHSI